MGRAADLLRAELDEAYAMLCARLEGLTDDEFFWEPVPDAWTVFRKPDGRWTYHYEEPDPVPAPFSTIAWRLTHVVLCKVMYHEYAFGPREVTWWTIETPGSVARSMEMLEEGQRRLVEAAAALDDGDLDAPRLTNWGEEWPAWQILWTMIHHDVHHGAEIGALRDLYRVRGPGP